MTNQLVLVFYMTSLTKVASVVLIALAPVINAQTPVETARATHNPALSPSNVLVAEDLPPSPKGSESDDVNSIQTENDSLSAALSPKSVDKEDIAPTDSKSNNNRQVKDQVKSFFKSAPIMAKVAFCESTYRHYNADGTVLKGKKDPDDVGVMQINKRYHQKTADKLGYDLYSIEGNMKYALWLYNKQGTQPWSASEPCWGN